MKAKVVIVAFFMMLAATVPAIAQGNGNGGGNSGQADSDDASESDDGADTTGGADRNGNSGNGRSDNGNNGNNGGGNGAGADNRSSNDLTIVPEQDLLASVKAGHAVSLASLVPNVQERTGGEIIDAQLVRSDHALIYAVKVLTPDGRVGIEYYNARSGIHIEAQ